MEFDDPSLSEDHAAMVASLDALCEAHVTVAATQEWDRDERYPTSAMKALADAGWAALAVPEDWAGAGASTLDLAVVHEALARHSLTVAQAYFSLWVLGAEVIGRRGTEEQRQNWLPRVAAGSARIAFALTEPEAGSDAAAIRTKAVQYGDMFRVTGQKLFITGAAVADVIITIVRTNESGRRHDGLSALLIDPHSAGVTIRPIKKLGLRALDLCEVFFDEVKVPRESVVGDVGGAWPDMMMGLARERLFLAAIAVGALQGLLVMTVEHARDRRAFGRPIGGFQMVAQKIVRMRLALETARSLLWRTAKMIDADDPSASAAASMAKLYASEAYVDATRDAMQICGGYGFTDAHPVSLHYRDAKYLEIGGGTSEIQTLVIARSMGLQV
jgi:alkylation response protein AidB-like acyl-CoA dehydrogenase